MKKMLNVLFILVLSNWSYQGHTTKKTNKATHSDYISVNSPSIMGYKKNPVLGELNQVVLRDRRFLPEEQRWEQLSDKTFDINMDALMVSTGVGYNYSSIYGGANNGYHCVISESLAKQKGTTIDELAKKLTSAGWVIICEVHNFNGVTTNFTIRKVTSDDFKGYGAVLFDDFDIDALLNNQ